MNEQKEVFGYARVSSRGQVAGDGFPRQREAILKFCELKGWTCRRIFEEPAVSGDVEGPDRPAFAEMMGLTGGVLPTTIVVERCDRLARTLIVGELLFEVCRKAGVEVFAADTGTEMVLSETEDPTRVLLRQFLGAIAQWNKSEIVLKLKKARDRVRVRDGRCEGVRPTEETRPEYAVAVEWIVSARERGDSFGFITKQLNLGSLKAPGGGRWGTSTVFKFYQRQRSGL